MRPYYLHHKHTLEERDNKTCPKCRQVSTGGFRCYVGHPSYDEDQGAWPDEELGFSSGDDLGRCSPEMVVLCAMIDEIMEALTHSARNLDDTLSKYVLAQYQEELKKTQDSLLKDEKEAEKEDAVYLSNSDNLKKKVEDSEEKNRSYTREQLAEEKAVLDSLKPGMDLLALQEAFDTVGDNEDHVKQQAEKA
jgi:hypothetical protein